jgi:antitoxin ParD1/3/4
MKIEKFTLALPQEMADLVRGAVESGEYVSTSEIMFEALRGWQARREADQREIDRLRMLIAEGEASGISPWPGTEEILAEIHRRAAEANEA